VRPLVIFHIVRRLVGSAEQAEFLQVRLTGDATARVVLVFRFVPEEPGPHDRVPVRSALLQVGYPNDVRSELRTTPYGCCSCLRQSYT
jgi:hypothetical protein